MSSRKPFIIFILIASVLLAVIGVFLLKPKKTKIKKDDLYAMIYQNNLSKGKNINVGDLGFVSIKKSQENNFGVYVTSVKNEKATIDQYTNRVILKNVYTGDFFNKNDSIVLKTSNKIGFLIPKKHIAMTINLTLDSSIAGMLEPNDRVDLAVTIIRKNSPKISTEIFLQGIDVLAVDANLSEGKINIKKIPASVTFSLTPKEALKLNNAQNIGNISLLLNNSLNKEEIDKKDLYITNRQTIPYYYGHKEYSSISKIKAPQKIVQIKKPNDKHSVIVYENDKRTIVLTP